MNMILKVTKVDDQPWLFFNEDRKIYFKRWPTADEVAAMGDKTAFHGIFWLENGTSRFSQITHPRGW